MYPAWKCPTLSSTDVTQLGQVEQEQVQDHLVVPDGEPELPADEGHAVAERGQRGLQLVHQALLEAPLADRAGQAEVVEDVGVAGQGLGQVGVRWWERVREVGGGGADPRVQPGGDLVLQDVAGPVVLHGLPGVPGA